MSAVNADVAIRYLSELAAKETWEARAISLRQCIETIQEQADEIERMQSELDRYKSGYQGSCYACEPVGEKNKRLRSALERAVAYFDKPHLRTLHCSDEFDATVDGMKKVLREVGDDTD